MPWRSDALPFDPELAAAIPMLPDLALADLPAARAMVTKMLALMPPPDATGVTVQDVRAPGPDGAPDVPLRVYRPDHRTGPGAVYDVHRGGFVLGDLGTDHAGNLELARKLGVVVVSVDYRISPETPFPGPLEDVYAGLVWTAKHADELEIDADRIVIRGVSAVGGLCAGLALLARDRGGPGSRSSSSPSPSSTTGSTPRACRRSPTPRCGTGPTP